VEAPGAAAAVRSSSPGVSRENLAQLLGLREVGMEFAVAKVAGASLTRDGRVGIEFVARSGESLLLVLDAQDQEEALQLLDAMRTRQHEAAPEASDAWSAAYRNVQSVEIGVDASLTTLLLDFDRAQRERIGVAIPVELARKIGHEIRLAANRAIAAARKQKAS
jgi:hypothetical protein